MKKKKIPKKRIKIKHKSLEMEGIDSDVREGEISGMMETFADIENHHDTITGEEITEEIDEEELKCPQCGGSLIKAPIGGHPMGVGKAYAQSKMWSYSISEEVVCSKCGLVLNQSSREVHR